MRDRSSSAALRASRARMRSRRALRSASARWSRPCPRTQRPTSSGHATAANVSSASRNGRAAGPAATRVAAPAAAASAPTGRRPLHASGAASSGAAIAPNDPRVAGARREERLEQPGGAEARLIAGSYDEVALLAATGLSVFKPRRVRPRAGTPLRRQKAA